jgi:hypothetical protein
LPPGKVIVTELQFFRSLYFGTTNSEQQPATTP